MGDGDRGRPGCLRGLLWVKDFMNVPIYCQVFMMLSSPASPKIVPK